MIMREKGELYKMTEEKTTKRTSTNTKTTPAKKPVEKKIEEQKQEITLDTQVEVFNNTTGGLLYVAKKGNGYLHLDNFMDSDMMTVEELQVLKNTSRSLLLNGWLYIDDEDVLDYLRLGSIKDSVKSPQMLEDAIDSGETEAIVGLFDKLSRSSKEVFYSIVKQRYEDRTFSDAHVIKEIEQKLGVAQEKSLLQG